MELGGHAPVLVFEDADIEAAAEACARAKFRNCGQLRASPSGFYVQNGGYERFANRFVAAFAPLAPLARFSNFDEVMGRANATPFGLTGYVFSRDLRIATLAAEGLEVGMVGVNETAIASAEAPFGGIEESGTGREGGTLGIKDYLEAKFVKTRPG